MKHNFSLLLTAALLSSALLLTACSGGNGGTFDVPSSESESAQESGAGVLSNFTATDLEGNTVDPSIFADYNLTMVNVWATYCGPCLREMPDLGELAAEYEGKGVRIVGLVSDTMNADGSTSAEQVETAKEIVASTGADYLHMLPSEDLLGLVYQINSVPTTFFVDSTGAQVGTAYIGAKSKEDWASIIDATLAEVQERTSCAATGSPAL